ncbi:hypothetical protein HUJ04_011468 [Dendroctonus ponderosae]|nr:hypothetical protein HUJ04_011468 [Dendroctonus ponderosae]
MLNIEGELKKIRGRCTRLKTMLDRCCVPGCKSNYTGEEYTTVFHFPRDDQRKQQWLRNIHRENFIPSKFSVVCSKHFEETFIIREARAERKDGSQLVLARDRMRLTANALPSIFPNQPKYLTK